MANTVDDSSIKIETVECNAVATSHFSPKQLNWQMEISNTVESIKIEQDPLVVWQSNDSMTNCQMQPNAHSDTSYEETEDASDCDMDLNACNPKQKYAVKQIMENATTKRKNQMKLPEIFRFFYNIERIHDSNAKVGAISATCNACHSRIKGFANVTSNFIKHLRLKHSEIHAVFLNVKQIGHSETLEVHETDSFDNRVMCYIIDNAVPLTTVESNSFRNLFKGTKFRVMSRSKLEMRLNAQFSQMCASVKNVIAAQKYVCTTADIWSNRQCSYFGYTCHWLDQRYKRISIALACKRFTGDNAQILEMINTINTAYNLSNLKIVATVTHNGANFSRAFRDFAIHIGNGYDDEIDCEANAALKELAYNALPNQIQCASHTLSLITSSDFVQILESEKTLKDRHTRVFGKCSALWRKCNCCKSSEIIQAVLSGPLASPVASRWNSVYDSVCCILSHKEKLDELCSKLALHNSCFSASDIQYLEEYRNLMTPIASTIEFLQMENNWFFGCLIPALTSLYLKLKRVADSSNLIDLRSMAIELQLKLKERFSKYLLLTEDANSAIIASVLCPTVKMRWFNALAKISSHERSADDVHKIVITEAVRHIKATENAYQVCQEQSVNHKDNDDFYEFDETDDGCETSDLDMSQPSPLPSTMKLIDDVETQLHSYLRDPGTTFEVLKKYPLLHDLGIKYNTPLASSAPVDRVLSLSNIINYSTRLDVYDNTAEKLILLKANSKI